MASMAAPGPTPCLTSVALPVGMLRRYRNGTVDEPEACCRIRNPFGSQLHGGKAGGVEEVALLLVRLLVLTAVTLALDVTILADEMVDVDVAPAELVLDVDLLCMELWEAALWVDALRVDVVCTELV